MIGFVLFIVALVLLIVLSATTFVISFTYYLLRCKLSKWFRDMALVLDVLGNVMCAQVFNIALKKKGGFEFGNPTHTISYVLGKNEELNKLTYIGKLLVKVLNSIEKNHCKKAVFLYEKK